jgi:hypothetical protein
MPAAICIGAEYLRADDVMVDLADSPDDPSLLIFLDIGSLLSPEL